MSFRTAVELDSLVIEICPLGGPVRAVPAETLSEIMVGWYPPTVRTKTGEYIFIEAVKAAQLADLGTRFNVPFVRRHDVWSDILEPFLDTQMSAQDQVRSFERLEKSGLTRAQVEAIRAQHTAGMLGLTALTWEWFHYGMCDLFEVTKAKYRSQFVKDVYGIADKGSTTPVGVNEFLRLHSKP